MRHLGDSELPGLFNESLELRPVALFNMAQAQELSGQVGTATETFRETAAASLEQKNEHLVWQSVAQHAQAKESEALSVLERAVILAAPEGYCRTFADAGAPVAELLAGLLATGRMDPEGASGGSSPTRITRRIVL